MMEQTKQYEYVDLGLPSGLKWATMNVGATSETDYGDYFQWGLTTPNTADDCTLESYRYCNWPDITLTKYNNISFFGTVDNITILETTDDAARANMGGDWRMPTKDEIQELIDNTDNEWVEDYNGSGVNGRKFTSKTDGRKYIFIPAAGYCLDGSVYNVGRDGFVWGSSLGTSGPNYAWNLGFYSDDCLMYDNRRYSGRSVRGVMD